MRLKDLGGDVTAPLQMAKITCADSSEVEIGESRSEPSDPTFYVEHGREEYLTQNAARAMHVLRSISGLWATVLSYRLPAVFCIFLFSFFFFVFLIAKKVGD